eukprot:8138848-Pyramimonas_sp.AAC.1
MHLSEQVANFSCTTARRSCTQGPSLDAVDDLFWIDLDHHILKGHPGPTARTCTDARRKGTYAKNYSTTWKGGRAVSKTMLKLVLRMKTWMV